MIAACISITVDALGADGGPSLRNFMLITMFARYKETRREFQGLLKVNFIVIGLSSFPSFLLWCRSETKTNIPSNFLCKYKSSFRHKSLGISIKMYQMNDKVFLTKQNKISENGKAPGRQKGKLNIRSAISVIFLTFNMFFVYSLFSEASGARKIAQDKPHLFICVPT